MAIRKKTYWFLSSREWYPGSLNIMSIIMTISPSKHTEFAFECKEIHVPKKWVYY